MNEWISVEDGLPNLSRGYSKSCLIHDGRKVVIGIYKEDEHWFSADPRLNSTGLFDRVTHWMPLPKPPRGNQNEQA